MSWPWLLARSSAWRVLVIAGVGAAVLAWAAGRLLERQRFGVDEAAATARAERDVGRSSSARRRRSRR